jgi:TetR/AcrR family transcriptional regulator
MRPLPDSMRTKVLAAADLFAQRGLDATKMEDLAEATGVPKATLYYYFESKEEILGFLFSEILDEVSRAIANAVNGPGTAAERLAAAVGAHLKVFEDFPMASRALQLDLGRAARMPDINERVKVAFIKPVHDLLVEGAADGSLQAVAQPTLVATAILGSITTTGMNTLTPHQRGSARKATTDLVGFILHGVSA